MTARERFEKSKEKLAEVEKLYEAWNDARLAADEEAQAAFNQVLAEEKILAQHPWILTIGENYSRLVCESKSDSWKELSDFAETNYHCQFVLSTKDGSLDFNDGEISIKIKDLDHLQSLINTYGIQIKLNPVYFLLRNNLQKRIEQIDQWEKALSTLP